MSYCLLRSPYGHDAFLVEVEHLAEVVKNFLEAPADSGAGSVTLLDGQKAAAPPETKAPPASGGCICAGWAKPTAGRNTG